MASRSSLLPAVRRFAAGIDVSPRAVRLVTLSRPVRGTGPARLEGIAAVPLPAGAMAEGEIVERGAVARAMRDAFARQPAGCAARMLHCAMALPGTAMLDSRLPLTDLLPEADMLRAREADGMLCDSAVEAAVMAEAERVAGLERHALAVDWRLECSGRQPASVAIAAAARQHLEARLECAATAGIALTAIDGEAHAALRALRYVAALEQDAAESCAALWIGSDGVYGWRLADASVAARMRYPALEYEDLPDALRELANGVPAAYAMIGGELDLLDGVGMTLADIGDVLGCLVLPFGCAVAAEGRQTFAAELVDDPACAVAFGLALRGVLA